MAIDELRLNQVSEYLLGTCKTLDDAIQAFDLEDEVSQEALEDALLNVDTEICVHCNWWHEVSELEYFEEHDGGLCEQCREELGLNDDE